MRAFVHGIHRGAKHADSSRRVKLEVADEDSLRGLIGLEASCEQRMPEGFLLVPQASLFWTHEFLGDRESLDVALEAGQGAAFSYAPNGAERDAVILSTALNVLSPWNLNGSIGYQAGFGFDGTIDHTATLGLDWPF